jgi:hypothetical protein
VEEGAGAEEPETCLPAAGEEGARAEKNGYTFISVLSEVVTRWHNLVLRFAFLRSHLFFRQAFDFLWSARWRCYNFAFYFTFLHSCLFFRQAFDMLWSARWWGYRAFYKWTRNSV